MSEEKKSLKRTLGPVMLWGLGVGYVISGEYFGWNLGLKEGGTYGMLAATLVITVMYLCFVLSYAELACAIPRAGGVFVYAERGLGRFWGYIAGIVQVIEFVFAPPAIAMAIGAYVEQLYAIDPRVVAIPAYLLFTGINIWGVKQAAMFELFVTILAVGELLLFIGVAAPSVEMANLSKNALPNGWTGAFAALPFAIWFYLAIEGVANAAEEARDPQRTVSIGFVSAILTLVVLALGVFVCTVGVAGWEAVVFKPGTDITSDAPLPLALNHVVGDQHILYRILVGVGLLGLIASFHGIILAAGRATLEMGRAGHFPKALGKVSERFRTPAVALVVNMLVGMLAILTGKTAEIITLACFGALALYILSMLSLFSLRKKEPALERPFKAVGYPVTPAIALVIATVALVAVGISAPIIAAIFFGLIALFVVVYVVRR